MRALWWEGNTKTLSYSENVDEPKISTTHDVKVKVAFSGTLYRCIRASSLTNKNAIFECRRDNRIAKQRISQIKLVPRTLNFNKRLYLPYCCNSCMHCAICAYCQNALGYIRSDTALTILPADYRLSDWSNFEGVNKCQAGSSTL